MRYLNGAITNLKKGMRVETAHWSARELVHVLLSSIYTGWFSNIPHKRPLNVLETMERLGSFRLVNVDMKPRRGPHCQGVYGTQPNLLKQ